MTIWGLSLAYRKISDMDEDATKAYELEKAAVKAMRGLLCSMLMQTEKVEQFKRTQNARDALHAKYSSITGKTVVGDFEWGHLQIDATSLFLLTLAQMTAAGSIIVFTLDEVAFVQNLVFYVETAYRTPDYGIWERGDKTNRGLPELNASSIGMAKAALEAINELDLFGPHGGPESVIHIMPDEAQQCRAILESMLPRESLSKETDASLFTVIGFPAFAVDNVELVNQTRKTILTKLEGTYGCKRFLRDGYKTAKEDPNRLHYEPYELMSFENIECQWPLFYAFLILDGLFNNIPEQALEYQKKLNRVLLRSEDGIPIVPELYTVPSELVDKEYEVPNSQKRVAAGKIPHMWGQALFILGQLIIEGFVSPGEMDPLNRRHATEKKPDIVVQVVLLAEDSQIQERMASYGIDIQTVEQIAPLQIHPASVLSKIYRLLGKNRRIGLTGRASNKEIGLLATCKLYMLSGKILAFFPQLVNGKQFYLGMDVDYLIEDFKTKIEVLKSSWKALGRPVIVYNLTQSALGNLERPPQSLLSTIKKLQSGYTSGTRVHLGKLSDFLVTSSITKLSFLRDINDQTAKHERVMIDKLMVPAIHKHHLTDSRQPAGRRGSSAMFASAVMGIVRRSRSISIKSEENPEFVNFLQARRQSRQSLGSARGSKTDLSHLAIIAASALADNLDMPAVTIKENKRDVQQVSHHLKDVNVAGTPTVVSPHVSPHLSQKNVTAESEEISDLIKQLKQSDNMQEQADILHYLYINKGAHWDTHLDENTKVPVKDLLIELYEKAASCKQWWLVRHSAGILKKRVEDLAVAATDLLVRQKQISVGLPPDNETVITSPLPPDELGTIITEACGDDHSMSSLTQELLVYLATYIRTQPHLFVEMLRIRVGLLIQVMLSELARAFSCPEDEATEALLNLSPFEMNTFLHIILSGNELAVREEDQYIDKNLGETIVDFRRKKRVLDLAHDQIVSIQQDEEIEEITERQGQWMRRRRLDGSLNRVPVGFYSQIWELLRKCQSLVIEGKVLSEALTKEMTKEEFKFALNVEMVLNNIPQPEYRQLIVEAMMVLSALATNEANHINMTNKDIQIDSIVKEANAILIKDLEMPTNIIEDTKGAADICFYLYDSAPSGRYGSMSYMGRALVNVLDLSAKDKILECCIS